MVVNPEQPEKASSTISIKFAGRVIEVKREQPRKARQPITVIL